MSQTPSPWCFGQLGSTLTQRFTHKVADIESLGNPVGGNTAEEGRKTVDIESGSTPIGVPVAGETSFVLWVSDQKDTLDGVERGSGESLERIDSRSRTLGVTLEVEAVSWVCSEGGLNLVDNIGSTQSRVLIKASGVDCAVDGTTGQLGSDSGVDGPESGRLAWQLAGTPGVDDGVPRACDGDCSFSKDGRGNDGVERAEKDKESRQHDGCCSWVRGTLCWRFVKESWKGVLGVGEIVDAIDKHRIALHLYVSLLAS